MLRDLLIIFTPTTIFVAGGGFLQAAVCIVEVKRKNEIDETVEKEVDEKLRRFFVSEGVSKRTALVYEGCLAPVVRGNGFFDAVISADELLSAK